LRLYTEGSLIFAPFALVKRIVDLHLRRFF
jgi:hypothetical protein